MNLIWLNLSCYKESWRVRYNEKISNSYNNNVASNCRFGVYNNIALNSLESRADVLEKKVKEIEKNMTKKEVETEINYIYGIATAYHPASGGINCDGNPDITATGQACRAGSYCGRS